MTWQSMDTAPKDGTEILLWVKRAGVPGLMIGHYAQGGGEDQPLYGPAWYYWNGSYFAECQEPLYWQPAPPQPLRDLTDFTEQRINAGCIAVCQSGKWECGQGTCAPLCMDQLGPVRPRPCHHAVKIFGPMVRNILTAADKVRV